MSLQNNSALSGTKWTVFSSIVNAIISVGFGAVLARLLTPEIFGLIAIASLVIAFASYFVKLGMGAALIQKEHLSSEEISFALTFSMGLGLLAAVLLALFSPFIASLFNKPDSASIIAVMGLSLWFSSVLTTMTGLLRREMEFKYLSITNIAQTIFVGVFSIIMAKLGFGIWSLAWPLIISQLLVMILLFIKIKKTQPVRLSFSFSEHGHLIQFGTRITFISILEYFGSNLDTIFVGRLFSTSQLGLYNRAYKLAYLPSENLITSITSVMFPVFSRLQKEPNRFKETQNKLFLFIGIISTCISMGMVPAARDIIIVLLGSQWLDSAPVLMIILFAVPFDFMSVSIAITFDASGKLREKTMIQTITIIALLIGYTLFNKFGLIGITIVLASSHVLRFLLYSIVNQRLLDISYKKLVKNNIMIFLAGNVTYFTSWIVVSLTTKLSLLPFPALILEISSCLFVFLFFLTINSPSFLGVNNLKESFSVVKSFLIAKGVLQNGK